MTLFACIGEPYVRIGCGVVGWGFAPAEAISTYHCRRLRDLIYCVHQNFNYYIILLTEIQHSSQ